MCGGLLSDHKTWEALRDILGGFVQVPADLERRNRDARPLRPTQTLAIVRVGPASAFEVVDARWWLVPHFHRGTLKDWGATTFNARIEEAPMKRTWQKAWRSQRCLIPAQSFFEKGRCVSRSDNQPLVLAGLWDEAETLDGPVRSFTILTRPAGADIAGFHPREPVALEVDQLAPWLHLADLPQLADPSPANAWHVVDERTRDHKMAQQGDLFG